jgi:hypothetical protein
MKCLLGGHQCLDSDHPTNHNHVDYEKVENQELDSDFMKLPQLPVQPNKTVAFP